MVGPALEGDNDIYHAELPGPVALLGQIFAGSFMRRPVPSPAPGVVREVGQPSGACFLMRRETWEEVGGFDDGFFLWYEDVDLAKRLEEAGYRNLLVGSARVGHAAARSFQPARPRDDAVDPAPLPAPLHREAPPATGPGRGSPVQDLRTWLRPCGPPSTSRASTPRSSCRGRSRACAARPGRSTSSSIDNGSTDGSVELARERFGEVEVLEMEQNLGFGPAINRAVRERPADPVILLNNDVECEPGLVEAMLDARADGADSVAGILLQERDPDRIDSAGVVADATLMGFDHLHGEPVASAAAAPDPLGPTGGAALYSKAAFDVRRRLRRTDLPLLRGPRPGAADGGGRRLAAASLPMPARSTPTRRASAPAAAESTRAPAGAAATCCAATG